MPTRSTKATRPAKKTAAKAAKKPAKKAAKKAAKAAKPAAKKTPVVSGTRVQANFFDLRSGRSRISFTESNIAGQPVLTYSDGRRTFSFTGADIQQDPQPIGLLLTVVLNVVPDAYSDLLTVLIPRVNLTNGEAKVTTEAIFTRVRTSIGGPDLVNGQVQTYTARTFTGTAQFIVS